MSGQPIGRPMEILLVEDSLVHARITMGALKNGQVKHRMTLVRDGEEALEFLCRRGRFARAPRPDLILLDLRLPKIDGLDVLRELKNDFELKDIPVVIMTASEDEEDRLKCEMLNVESYIIKPVDMEKFLGIVQKLKKYWHADVILPVTD
jgi:chemotaxis family two-component system response regulator Rcp1